MVSALAQAIWLPFARAHSGLTMSGQIFFPPVIDGRIDPCEWFEASAKPFTVRGTAYSGTLYMMNDGQNLYIALSIDGDVDLAGSDGFAIYFDNAHAGGTSHQQGDDLMYAFGDSTFRDHFYDAGTSSFPQDVNYGGSCDGLASASRQGTSNHFEVSHPLDSVDNAHDFSLSIGQTVGFGIVLGINGYSYFLDYEGLGRGYPYDPSSYANYVISALPVYSGYAVIDAGTGAIYFIWGAAKYWISSMTAFYSYGFNTVGLKSATPGELALPSGFELNGNNPLLPLRSPTGSLVGDVATGAIYYAVEGKLYHVTTMTAFYGYGFQLGWIKWVPNSYVIYLAATYGTGYDLDGASPLPPIVGARGFGYIAVDGTTGAIYFFYGRKCWISSMTAYYAYGFNTVGLRAATAAELALPSGFDLNGNDPLPPSITPTGGLIGDIGTGAIYYVVRGVLYHITTPSAFLGYGFQWTWVKWVPSSYIAYLIAMYGTGYSLDGITSLPWP